MNGKLALIASMALFTFSAYAANPQASVHFTFECSGNSAGRIGSCPNGGRPELVIQGANGNFYGTAQVSTGGSSAPNGGTVFSLTSSGTFKLLHTFAPGRARTIPTATGPVS